MKLEVCTFDAYCLYDLKGSIGWEDSHILDIEFGKTHSLEHALLVVQLSSIRHIASSTLGILAGHVRKRKTGSTYIICSEPYVLDLLEHSGLQKLLQDRIFPDMQSFAQSTGLPVNTCAIKERCCYDTWQLQSS